MDESTKAPTMFDLKPHLMPMSIRNATCAPLVFETVPGLAAPTLDEIAKMLDDLSKSVSMDSQAGAKLSPTTYLHLTDSYSMLARLQFYRSTTKG